MTHYEDAALAGRALRPEQHHYFIAYSSAASAGLQFASSHSPDSIEKVRQAFEYEFQQQRAQVLFINCLSA